MVSSYLRKCHAGIIGSITFQYERGMALVIFKDSLPKLYSLFNRRLMLYYTCRCSQNVCTSHPKHKAKEKKTDIRLTRKFDGRFGTLTYGLDHKII